MRQQFRHRHGLSFQLNEELGPTVFPQQLSASTTRCNGFIVAQCADCDESTTTMSNQFADHSALGAQSDAVRSVLHVAPRDYSSIGGEARRANPKLGVGDVSMLHCIACCLAKGVPVDAVHCRQR